MKTSDIVELLAAALMVIGLLAVFINRWKTGRGLGARVIQLLAVIFVIPAILILALEKFLTAETVATLFGTMIGYLLSGIGKFKPRQTSKPNTGEKPKV
jgi:phosphatidylserine synthase